MIWGKLVLINVRILKQPDAGVTPAGFFIGTHKLMGKFTVDMIK